MVYCQTCGKELGPYEFNQVLDKNGKYVMVCDECKNSMPSTGATPISKSTYDNWDYSSDDHLKVQRPLGITILAVLEIIGGIISIVGINLFEYIYPYLSLLPNNIIFVIYAIAIILGILQIIIGYGLLKGKSWSWTAEFALRIINGALGSLFGFIFAIIIVYYLTRPNVKEFFGK